MRADFSAKLDDQLTIGFPVVAVHLADVGAVGDGLGVVGGEAAHGGGLRVGADEEAGEVEVGVACRVVAAEQQLAPLVPGGDAAPVPEGVARPVAGDAEMVVGLTG